MNSAEYSVRLVGVNRLSACREFCGVHSCTKCWDGVSVVVSFPSSLVGYEGSTPTCACVYPDFLMTCSCCFLVMVMEKRGGKGSQRGDV